MFGHIEVSQKRLLAVSSPRRVLRCSVVAKPAGLLTLAKVSGFFNLDKI